MSSLEDQIGALAEAAFEATEPVAVPVDAKSGRSSVGRLAAAAIVVLAVAAVVFTRGTEEEVILTLDAIPSDAIEVVVEIADEPTLDIDLPLLDQVDESQQLTVPGVDPFIVGEVTDLEGVDMGTYGGDARMICTGRLGSGPTDGNDAHGSCGPNEPNLAPARSGELVWHGDGRYADTAVWLVPDGTEQVTFTMSGEVFRQGVVGDFAAFALVEPCVPFSTTEGCAAYRMVAFDAADKVIATFEAAADPNA